MRNDKQPIADSVDISWKLTVAITSFCYSHSDFVIIPITDCRKLMNNNEKAAKKVFISVNRIIFQAKINIKSFKIPSANTDTSYSLIDDTIRRL